MTDLQKELQDFPFPLVDVLSQFPDDELKYRLPLELFLKHEGLKITFKGQRYDLKIYDSELLPRDALRFWLDKQVGGSHFYGKLKLPILEFIEESSGESVIGHNRPRTLKEVELTRLVTEDEITEQEIKEKIEVGDRVRWFNESFDVLLRAREIAKRHFPGFNLIIPE